MPPENINQAEQINKISSEIAKNLSFLLIHQKRARRRKLISSLIIVILVIIIGCFSMIDKSRQSAVQKEYSLMDSSVFSKKGFISFKIGYPSSWNYLEGIYPDEGDIIYFSPNPIQHNGGLGGEIMLYLEVNRIGSTIKNSRQQHTFTNNKGEAVATIRLYDERYRKEYEQMISLFVLL